MTDPSRHPLDTPGARRVWHYPLPRPAALPSLLAELKLHGVTGLVPQESDRAIAWCRALGEEVVSAGLDLVPGLGKVNAKGIVAALDLPAAAGVMVDQEDWESVPDSVALCHDVLAARPSAPDRVVDCFYPCLTTTPDGSVSTGHKRIGAAWAPLCGGRAPQCYWHTGSGGTRDMAPDGFALSRLYWARRDYPKAGGSPAERVVLSRQLYRASVNDHVWTMLAESERAVWLWNWPELDAEARLALRIVAALESRGFRGPMAICAFQKAEGLAVDGIVGPQTCRALGLAPSPGAPAMRWTNRGPQSVSDDLAYVVGEPHGRTATVERHGPGWRLRSPLVPGGAIVDPVLFPVRPGVWRVAFTNLTLHDVPSPAPWLAG